MTTPPPLQRIASAAKRRRAAVAMLRWMPWLIAAAALLARVAGTTAALAFSAIALLALAAYALRRIRGIDHAWLIRSLDAHTPELQDSSDLLFADTACLGPLQALQQARIFDRLPAARPPDVREPVPWRPVRVAWLLAVLVCAAAWLAPSLRESRIEPARPSGASSSVPKTQGLQSRLDIASPDYTGFAARTLDTLDAEAAQGSTFTWTMRFAIEPGAARLRFIGGESLDLVRDGDAWRAARTFDITAMYRIELDGAPALPEHAPYRIDIRPDQPPQLKIVQPERTLTLLDAAARRWHLAFDATDDYGLGDAQLELTLAQGSGEQVTVSERRVALRGTGDTRHQHIEHDIDLASLGYAQGDDLIARIEVRDRRTPVPNITRSASFILRWPPSKAAAGTGVDGLVQKALPAYFRSQRQIIIDTEALISERATLDADTALARSDTIGADQRVLRLRYGQFLGEESESPDEHGHEGEGEHASSGDAAMDLMRASGHLHDLPEAATLLDSGTRELLRSALNEMWSSERELRSGNPVAALPFEHRALDFVKRVQQADRIYLARVGLELPELDAARRLTGVRERSAARADPLARRSIETVPRDVWIALQSDAAIPLDDFTRWLRVNPSKAADSLTLLAEIEALQANPACADCRTRLARGVWPLLDLPAAAPALRASADAVGRAYLDAIAPSDDADATP